MSSRLLFQLKNLWKFLQRVSKPESKRKVNTCESNKAYDATKRKRTFQPHWLQMYKWLHFDGESQLMSCDWCKKFVKGTNNGFSQYMCNSVEVVKKYVGPANV
jgi:hypothetical protein